MSAGDLDRAGAVLADGLARALELGLRKVEAGVLHSQGRLGNALGERRRAAERWLAALGVYADSGSTTGVADCIEGIAGLALAARRHADASPLVAWAAACPRT